MCTGIYVYIHDCNLIISLVAHNSVRIQRKKEKKQKSLLFSFRSRNKLIIAIYLPRCKSSVEIQQWDSISCLKYYAT